MLGTAIWNPLAAEGMRRLVAEFRPHLVHTHKLYPQLSVAPVVVAGRHGVPVVQTLHDFEMISASPIDARGGIWDHDETRVRFKLLNSATRPIHRRLHAPRVSRFVAVSRFVERVHARHGIEASVLPNFVFFAESELGRDPMPFHERDGIVFLGRLQPEKGARHAVEMAHRLPGKTVTLVGTGDLERELRCVAESTPHLRVAGFLPDDDLRELLRRTRVVVIPSLCQDAGPLVPLESMAHGTPVVAYAMGGLAEYVVDSGGGLVVPVDVQALARVALEVHDDRELWQKLSARGLDAVARHHTPAVYAERIETIYEDVVRSRRSS